MADETLKLRPNYDVLFDRQLRTMHMRTDDFRNLRTPDILAKYPWLTMPRMVRTKLQYSSNNVDDNLYILKACD